MALTFQSGVQDMTTQFHAIDQNMIAALRNLRTVAIQEQVNATMGNFVTSAKARYIELNVSGIREPFRLKPNLQEVVDYVNAFRRTASGRALIAAGLDLVKLFNGARATLFAGKEPTKFELVTENGKLIIREVKPSFKDALKVQAKKATAKKEPKADTVKKPRTTAAQRAAEIDGEHKLIAEVASGKKPAPKKKAPAKKQPVKKANAPKTDAK